MEMQETFADYTAKTLFERPLLSGVAYAERVLRSERERFEAKQGWSIKTMQREPSPVQDEYAPVIFSQQTVSYLESLDMMSGEVMASRFHCVLHSCLFLFIFVNLVCNDRRMGRTF